MTAERTQQCTASAACGQGSCAACSTAFGKCILLCGCCPCSTSRNAVQMESSSTYAECMRSRCHTIRGQVTPITAAHNPRESRMETVQERARSPKLQLHDWTVCKLLIHQQWTDPDFRQCIATCMCTHHSCRWLRMHRLDKDCGAPTAMLTKEVPGSMHTTRDNMLLAVDPAACTA